jgi:hypothetical protein
MPDVRAHRGPHPDDATLFAPQMLPRLRAAVADFSLLLTKGYAGTSALKLVGDHFSLTQRQRLAVMRAACSDQQRQSRREHRVPVESLPGRPLAIDGYNLLITTEAAHLPQSRGDHPRRHAHREFPDGGSRCSRPMAPR